MKLKKFLLRYDPPGVGMEVEDEEMHEVRHKDLPDKASSAREIEALVDNLIASEPSVLTRRRHQRALVQLLGRLYNIEVAPDMDSPKSAHANPSPDLDGASWRHGQEVVLVGLEGRLQVHNGEVGKLMKVNVEKDKCEVRLVEDLPVGGNGGEDKSVLKVKGLRHILPVASGGQLITGTPVVICRLRNHAELNGWPGRILEKSEEQNRYVVRAAESGQLFRVKRDNLVQVEPDALSRVGMDEAFHMEYNEQMKAMKARLDQTQSGFGAAAAKSNAKGAPTVGVTLPEVPGAGGLMQPGTRVHLTGLRVATAYNGVSAEIISVDRAKSLYQVRLDDGSCKTVKAENVRSGPGPPSGKSSMNSKNGRRAAADVMK